MSTNKLNILWTNADPVTAKLMVFMYSTVTMRKKLWDEMTIIIWGATAKLVAENTEIQNLINEAKTAGVRVSACKSCADQLGVSETLEKLEIEQIYWGEPLTDILKADGKLLTI